MWTLDSGFPLCVISTDDRSVSALFSQRWRSRRQRVTTLVTTAALIACTVGVPMPRVKVEKDSTEAYPCQDCGCGCVSAEMCWRNCCCYSQQEKLAWAEKNGVVPPKFVVKAARAEMILAAAKAQGGSCCSQKQATCCQQDSSCCVQPTCCQQSDKPQPEETQFETVMLLQVLRCQGLGAHWVFALYYLPVEVATPELDLLPLESVEMRSPIFISFSTPPGTPPPQIV